MNLSTVYSSFRRIWRDEGLSRAAEMLVARLKLRLRERRYGIDTEQVILLNELGLDAPGRSEYGASDYDDFHVLMQSVSIEPQRDVFVDYGAGLGRAVILAATYPFKKVIGVELSGELAGRAQRNIKHAERQLRCRDVTVLIADATLYTVPPDATVIYFNNPFFGDILDKVLVILKASQEAVPRRVIVICNLPPASEFERQIRGQAWLTPMRELDLPSGRLGLILQNARE